MKNKIDNKEELISTIKYIIKNSESQEEAFETVDDLTELDDIAIQKYCMEQEAYESLDSLDSFNYMEI